MSKYNDPYSDESQELIRQYYLENRPAHEAIELALLIQRHSEFYHPVRKINSSYYFHAKGTLPIVFDKFLIDGKLLRASRADTGLFSFTVDLDLKNQGMIFHNILICELTLFPEYADMIYKRINEFWEADFRLSHIYFEHKNTVIYCTFEP